MNISFDIKITVIFSIIAIFFIALVMAATLIADSLQLGVKIMAVTICLSHLILILCFIRGLLE